MPHTTVLKGICNQMSENRAYSGSARTKDDAMLLVMPKKVQKKQFDDFVASGRQVCSPG